MRKYERFFQMNADCFIPFNEAPTYLKGSVMGAEGDTILISGHSKFQVLDWYKIGFRTERLCAHSFAFSIDAVPTEAVGAYSIGINGDCSINISHFVRSSMQLLTPRIAENAYSGWAYDNLGRRTQEGRVAPWESLGRRHNLMVLYDADAHLLECMVNGLLIHAIRGDLTHFTLAIRFEAIGIEGDFNVAFDNICYYSLDSEWENNVAKLKAWDPQYAPVFVSYCHSDKEEVQRFVENLRRTGVRVLGDWDFRPGDSLQSKIAGSISRSGYLLVFLSKKSVMSPWMAKELEIGMDRELKSRRVYVLPILIEDCPVPLFLADKLYADLRDDSVTQKKVLDTLRRHGSW